MKSVLFVCLGNICRSPSAEAVMRKMAKERGVDLKIDSAGMISHHAGEPADARMMTHASKRGYILTSISRPVTEDDFSTFDLIIGMDASNMSDLYQKLPDEDYSDKLSLMTDYCSLSNYQSVPDPYYGGDDGFELVLDLLEDACNGLLNFLS